MVRKFLYLGVFLLAPSLASAACHVVTPAGSGSHTGADWNNAITGVGGSFVRGDIYYLADGNYGDFTFSQADSGSVVIEFRKATNADHCAATGYNNATMGSSQAVFTSISVEKDFVKFNGNGTQTGPGCGGAPGTTVAGAPPTPADCGIKVDDSAGGGYPAVSLGDFNNSIKVTGYEFDYVEEKSSGSNTGDQIEFWAPFNNTPGDGGIFTHIYGHNAGCVYFQNGDDGRIVQDSYFWGTEVLGGGACHGQFSYSYNTSTNPANAIFRRNVLRGITGTAVWTMGTGGSRNNYQFYDNVIVYNAADSWAPFFSDGIIACINGVTCTNFVFSQNSIINIGSGNSGINDENGAGSYTVQNNIWYLGAAPAMLGGSAAGTNHSSFLHVGASCPSGTANVCDNASANPFVNWPSNNFNLASDAADWNNRINLSGALNTDAAGSAFTTDRGAFQFSGAPVPGVSFSPSSLSFANQVILTTSGALSTTLTNTGGATLTITSIGLAGTNPGDFNISLNTCAGTLAAAANCAISITFTPTVAAARSATISMVDDASGSPHTVPLSGTGVNSIPVPVPHRPVIMGSLPSGTVGVLYSACLTSSGATPPLSWSAFPTVPGLAIAALTGCLSGTPTTAGTYSVTVSLSDSYVCGTTTGCTNTATPVTLPVVINTAPVATLSVGTRIQTKSTANIRATAVNGGFGTLYGTEPAGAVGTVLAVSTATIPACTGCVWIQVKFDTCVSTIPSCTGWMGSDNMSILTAPVPTLGMTCSGLACTINETSIPSGTPFSGSVSAGGKTAGFSGTIP